MEIPVTTLCQRRSVSVVRPTVNRSGVRELTAGLDQSAACPVGNPYVNPGWAATDHERHLPNSTTTYLTIAEVEARNKNRAPWRQADPSRPTQDGAALLHLRAQPALKPKKDFLPYAARRHPAVHCATRVLWRRPRAPS